jgi:hypothetical protein
MGKDREVWTVAVLVLLHLTKWGDLGIPQDEGEQETVP